MKRFLFKSKNSQGQIVKGEVEASDINNASKLIRGKGLLVLSLKPVLENPISILKELKE